MPMTVKPAAANSTARGSPTYPNPTTPTRARLVRIFPARTCAVARGKVPFVDSAMKPPVSHSARGRAEKHAPAGHKLLQVIRKEYAIRKGRGEGGSFTTASAT